MVSVPPNALGDPVPDENSKTLLWPLSVAPVKRKTSKLVEPDQLIVVSVANEVEEPVKTSPEEEHVHPAVGVVVVEDVLLVTVTPEVQPLKSQ